MKLQESGTVAGDKISGAEAVTGLMRGLAEKGAAEGVTRQEVRLGSAVAGNECDGGGCRRQGTDFFVVGISDAVCDAHSTPSQLPSQLPS